MKTLAAIGIGAARFDRLSIRERVLIVAATLAAVVGLWDMLLTQPLEVRRKTLTAEVDTLHTSIAAMSQAMDAGRATDPTTIALRQITAAEQALAAVNSKLESAAAGILPPQRMAQVIQDVLRQRRNVTLISLRSEPVTNLSQQSSDSAGPYLHPVELIVEGRYLDILGYLRALEALHWRIYWKTLELDSAHYPLNRVRIELVTVSLDRSWLGL